MNENSVVSLRQKDEIDDPLTEILRTGARPVDYTGGCSTRTYAAGSTTMAGLFLGSLSHPVEHRAILGAMGLRKIQVPAQTQKRRSRHWLARIAQRQPQLFAHWTLLHGNGRNIGSRMSREVHARLCVQRRLACSAGIKPAGVKAEPRSLDSRGDGKLKL